MAERDRTTINLTSVKERIENLRSDNAWRALPLSKKVVLLLEEYLDQLQASQPRESSDARQRDGEIALLCWQKVIQGEIPTSPELIKLAAVLDADPSELRQKITKLRS